MTVLSLVTAAMTEADYDAERAKLRELYGDSSTEAIAKRDRGLALLFARSGWTQEQLGRKEGKSQQWIAYRLQFGRFLNFTTMVVKFDSLPKNLTERRFRAYWDQTDKAAPKEEFRFREVIKALQSESVMAPRRPQIGKDIREHFADGKWHNADVIATKLGADADHVRETLDGVCKNQTYNCKAEKKRVGAGVAYRIFKMDRSIASSELTEKLLPIVQGIEAQGKQSMASISPGTVLMLASKLRKLLDEWTQ